MVRAERRGRSTRAGHLAVQVFAAALLGALAYSSVALADNSYHPNKKAWEAAIAAVEAKAKRMTEKADALNAEVHLGTANNEIDVPEHSCSILGRMLGMQKFSKHLEQDVPEVLADGQAYRFAALSLSNWTLAAENMLKISREERVTLWNLECVGHHRISALAYIPVADDSPFYRVDRGGLHLRVLGSITEGFAQRLIDALDANPGVEHVSLGSGGGFVREAILAGLEIRRRRLNTTLYSNCYSACPLVFIGGVNRTIWSPHPELGFHHPYTGDGVPLPRTSALFKHIATYARSMGVDPSAVLRFMLAASPTEMNMPDFEELCAAKVTTAIQRAC